MLYPAFLFAGARSLTAILFRMRGGRMLLLLPILAFLCCNLLGALMVLALWGANGTLLVALQAWLRRRADAQNGPRE
jgi:hypothetical protein